MRMVGPVGLEPTTKGFTVTLIFLPGADYLTTLNRVVRVRDALACY